MSVVSSIRDYVEFLNTLSDSLGSEFTSSKFITETCFYFLKTLQYSVYYLFSLQWLRDFTLLPVTIPQISHAIFSENFFLESPEKIFFEFLEIPSLNQNKFILGFFNSFFLTLPITVTHIIAFRRLIIQGIPAAVFSFLGFILGQTLFILCVTFGIRSILIPWLSLEPFNYLLGLILIFQVVYTMVAEPLTPLKWQKDNESFKKFFLVSLILSWCEQSSIFQYFSNITLTAHPSILEGFSTKTTLASFFSHSNYILGIFLGSVAFSIFWGFVIWQIKNLIVSLTGISLSRFVQTINRGSFIVVLGFTLSSIPFYGLDYLFTGPLGFISQDSVFKNTLFAQNQIKDPLAIGQPDEPLNFDISPFDRGQYLLFPENTDPYSFEDLNYRGELDWTTRSEKQSNISDPKASFLSITKIFKKQKANQSVNPTDFNSQELNTFEKSNSFLPENEIFKDQDISFMDSRFQDWYNFKNSDLELASDPNKENKSIEENFENFNLNTFSPDFLRTKSALEGNLEKKIKEKYYSNPIYKNLLALDIDLFLNRQPRSSFLKVNQENDLYQKRSMLNSYYDSLRLYTNLPSSQKFNSFFDGSKSFTNKVYNQQFKGTWRSIRRWFSLQLTEDTNTNSVLKYDQPLYENKVKFSPYHEEIPEIEFFEKNQNAGKGISNPFLPEFLSKPLYAGWDENLRKFVITNKLLPRANAGYEINISQDWSSKFKKEIIPKQSSSNKNLNNSQKINFSVWPKPKTLFDQNAPEVPFTVLFDTKMNQMSEADDLLKFYKSLPGNYKIILRNMIPSGSIELEKHSKTGSIFDTLVPKRGGFIWPGNLSFDLKNMFK